MDVACKEKKKKKSAKEFDNEKWREHRSTFSHANKR
jgi:hypothetical protein